MAPRRGPTADFLFADGERAAVRAQLVAAAPPGAKISVATVAKAVGERWKALKDEERERRGRERRRLVGGGGSCLRRS